MDSDERSRATPDCFPQALYFKIIGHVTGLEGSHGITIDPKTRLGYADSSVTRTISIFDPDSFQIVKTMPALEDADGEVFDTFSNQVFVTGAMPMPCSALIPPSLRRPN